jgi:hypothetical protein
LRIPAASREARAATYRALALCCALTVLMGGLVRAQHPPGLLLDQVTSPVLALVLSHPDLGPSVPRATHTADPNWPAQAPPHAHRHGRGAPPPEEPGDSEPIDAPAPLVATTDDSLLAAFGSRSVDVFAPIDPVLHSLSTRESPLRAPPSSTSA